MSKYPDHQVQALASAISRADIAPLKGSRYWMEAEYALEFLGIEPDLPPTVTITVELPREEAEAAAAYWYRVKPTGPYLTPTPASLAEWHVAEAIREALQ